jgi:hypothetical protein
MIDFIRPSTRVYVGEDGLTPATIIAVHVLRELTCSYTVEYWREGILTQVDLERWQFSTRAARADAGQEPIENQEDDNAI